MLFVPSIVTAGGRTFCPVRVAAAEAWATVELVAVGREVCSRVDRREAEAARTLGEQERPGGHRRGQRSDRLRGDGGSGAGDVVTVNRALPGWAAGPVVTLASVDADEVPVVLPQVDCLVMVSGTNALAAVCSAVKSELRLASS